MTLRPSHLALGLLAAGALAPRTASAQFLERLSFHAEAEGGSVLADHQRNDLGYNVALQGSLRLGVHLVGPLAIQVSGGAWLFPAPAGVAPATAGMGYVTTATGGLRLEPSIGHVGRLFLDGNIGAGFTGSDILVRLAFDVGLGFEFHLGGAIYLGPAVRYGQLIAGSNDLPSNAQYWSAGLSLGIHPTHAAAVPPPPPLDTDSDGVPDASDMCPTVPAGNHPDLARPGCPVTDRDGDGVPDDADQCPDVPAGNTPDPTRAGCPAGDRDHDGVLDPVDQCPDTPAGNTPDPARAGCPAGDRDHDGVPDPVDQCPDTPAGSTPDPARAGCPSPDRDGDSVPDAVDHCPDQPGAPSPDPARNGCPGLVQITNGQVRINRPVFFATNRDTILPRSFPVLQAVADALRVTTSIHRVSVEGHTDRMGAEPHNQDLSQRRAASVMHWLTEHGVTADRLEAHGFGSGRPVASNLLASGRAANRRVEFHIVDPASSGAASH